MPLRGLSNRELQNKGDSDQRQSIVVKRSDDKTEFLFGIDVSQHLQILKEKRENGQAKDDQSPNDLSPKNLPGPSTLPRKPFRRSLSPFRSLRFPWSPRISSVAANSQEVTERPRVNSLGLPSTSPILPNNANSITLHRTDDSREFHIGQKEEYIYNHLVGYMKWSEEAAKEHLEKSAFSEKNTQVDWREVTTLKILNDGPISQVFLASWKDRKVVAKVEKLNSVDKGKYGVISRPIKNELVILEQLHHPNIVRLNGAGSKPTGEHFLLLQYLEGGVLGSKYDPEDSSNTSVDVTCDGIFVPNRRRNLDTLVLAVKRSFQVAQALEYLQLHALPGLSVSHMSLRPDNLGFDCDGTVKLLDFGLARVLERAEKLNETCKLFEERGRIRYVAPEVILKQPYDASCDIYSLGIIMWELAACRAPFGHIPYSEFFRRVILDSERPSLEYSWPTPFLDIIARCWSANPLERPSIKEIETALLQTMVELEIEPHKQGVRIGD